MYPERCYQFSQYCNVFIDCLGCRLVDLNGTLSDSELTQVIQWNTDAMVDRHCSLTAERSLLDKTSD